MKWARWGEVGIALALIVSAGCAPLDTTGPLLRIIHLAAGGLVALISFAAMWTSQRRLHLLNLLIAVALIATAYRGWPDPSTGQEQVSLLTGMLLVLLSLLPTRTVDPPLLWRGWYEEDGFGRPRRAED